MHKARKAASRVSPDVAMCYELLTVMFTKLNGCGPWHIKGTCLLQVATSLPVKCSDIGMLLPDKLERLLRVNKIMHKSYG